MSHQREHGDRGEDEHPERSHAHGWVRRQADVHEQRGDRLEQREFLGMEERRAEHRHLGMEQVDPGLVIDERRIRGPGLTERMLLEEWLRERRQARQQRERDDRDEHADVRADAPHRTERDARTGTAERGHHVHGGRTTRRRNTTSPTTASAPITRSGVFTGVER